MTIAALALGACSDEPTKKRLGGTCGEDSDCAEGVCGGGICLDPSADDDLDGLQNGLEIDIGTNPVAGDTDNDGHGDKAELDQSLGLLDVDGDGTPDVLESATADGDGDCLPDQFDPDNAVANNDLTGLVPVVCRQVGVCAGASLAVACPGGPGTARCDYGAVTGYEAEEATCDGLDNDCDGATDEHGGDLDDDGVADCQDTDDDGDEIDDADDNCPGVANASQDDADGDDRGDACDAPAIAVVLAIDPDTVGNITSPVVSGSCEAGSTVAVLAAASDPCAATSPVTATCTAGAFSVAVPVSAPVTQLATRATNPAGLESACAPAALGYTLDTTTPTAPTGVTLSPASPSPSTTATIEGTAEASATLTFHTTSDCSGAAVGTGVASTEGAFAIAVTLPGDGAFTLRVVVVDPAGNTSGCLSVPDGELVVAASPPAAPVAGTPVFTPTSPSPIDDVTVTGCAVTGTTTRVFAGPCAGEGVAATATAGTCAPGTTAFTATLTVADDALTAVYARSSSASGVTSACAWLGSFRHDDSAPAAPTVSGVTPASPSASPVITIEADTHGEAAFIWLTSSCTGAPAGALFGGDTAFVVPQNQTFTVYGRTFDAAGNSSACTSLFTYTHDAQAPIAPSPHAAPFSPASPAPSASPTVSACTTGNAVVSVFSTPGCTGSARATLTTLSNDASCPGGRAASGVVPAITDGTMVLSGRVTSATGVQSGCAYLGSYTHDDDAPGAPGLTEAAPASPSPFRLPRLTGTAEPGATIDIHLGACGQPSRGSGVTSAGGAWSVTVDLPPTDGVYALFARATDAAGNTACGAIGSYELDTAPPLPPTGASGKFEGPSYPDATIIGCAEVGVRVDLSISEGCATTVASGDAGALDASCPAPPARGRFDTALTVLANTPTSVFARAVDAAGNRSDCVPMGELYWDTIPPGQPTITETSATDWSTNLTFEVGGVVVSEDTRTVRVYEVPPGFAGGPCPDALVGEGTSDGASFQATATVGPGAQRTIAVQAVDAQGNASACGFPRDLVVASTATALVPDPETRTTYVLADGAHIFWHLPDGRLDSYVELDESESVASGFTFEGMFVTVAMSGDDDGVAVHNLGSYALAPGEDVVFELGELDEGGAALPWSNMWPLWMSIQAPPTPCQDCFGYSKYVHFRCGQGDPFYNESDFGEFYIYPECMQNLVCHAVDEFGECVEYDFELDLIMTMYDWDQQLAYYFVAPTQRFDETDVEISLSFEGASWRSDFDEVDVTVTNATGEPRGSYFQIESVWGDRDLGLAQRSLEMFALPEMPAQRTARLIPGLDQGSTATLIKPLQLGDGDGLEAMVQKYERRVGPPPTALSYAQDTMLPLILPVAMPDYADPDRPFIELYRIGEEPAEASIVLMFGADGIDGDDTNRLSWSMVMSGERPFAFQYPEFPDSMPWLGFADYQDNLEAQFVNLDFDFTTGWEELRAFFGWRLLTMFEGGAPDNLPAEFGFEMSLCCGGRGRGR
ncbi:MAG: hypothetical protein IT385_11450 [Deltaproteobacteria bacterium]|nr:hypothetical protein [Deltaproteobacteria bacterium]